MDKEIRNVLQRATQDARRLLEEEYREQLEGLFDILLDGTIAAEAGPHLDAPQRLTRQKVVAAIEHNQALGITAAEAVAMHLREAAFTTLNRFAALKMLEARDLVQECISKGELSAGFKEFSGLAPGLASLPGKGYRQYIESIFDEIGREVRVLFNRHEAVSQLWPRRRTFNALLDVLNQANLACVWVEDETIGWVYQYFNSQEERSKMRDESAAPRNSWELAVRNQFFTPRYVVEYLTDNTLGRIWYEMRKGDTILTEQCRYLIRRPNEKFLEEGEAHPDDGETATDNLTQEELLLQPEYIPFRHKKDPREIRMLDPAGGSGHFGLYCFDLFLTIYAEAYEDPELGVILQQEYPERVLFLATVPQLILSNNIHIIDIDPRAVQIAGLALWLRTQRAYNDMSLPRALRPAIKRTNVVVAEPMPGKKEMFEDFLRNLRDDRLENLIRRVLLIAPDCQVHATKVMAESLCDLAKTVWDNMTLAGEAGSLLDIEQDIVRQIGESRAKWEEDSPLFRVSEFSLEGNKVDHCVEFLYGEKRDFWESAERLVLAAMKEFAEQFSNENTMSRQLFVEDAAHGFSFIDICRKRYDVALMNPPFGDCTSAAKPFIFGAFGRERIELGGCFITKTLGRLDTNGKLGVIANRTLLFAATLNDWRSQQLAGTETIVDFGHGVLDALVETAAFTIGRHAATSTFFVGVLDTADKEECVLKSIQEARIGQLNRGALRDLRDFRALYGGPFAYWAPSTLIRKLSRLDLAESVGAIARQGLATCDNFRFLRLSHEIPHKADGWRPLTKGGEYQPFWADVPLRVKWHCDGAEVKAYIDALHGQWSRVIQSVNLYGLPGATYSERTASSLSLRVLPRHSIFDKVGPFVGAETESLSMDVSLCLIGLSYTTPYRFLIETAVGLRDGTTSGSAARHYLPSMIPRLPLPDISNSEIEELKEATLGAIRAVREMATTEEPNGLWHEPLTWSKYPSLEEFSNARMASWCDTLAKIYHCAEKLEELSMRAFEISSSDRIALENVAGRNVLSYKRNVVDDSGKLRDLLDLPSDMLIAELVAAGKAHATIYCFVPVGIGVNTL